VSVVRRSASALLILLCACTPASRLEATVAPSVGQESPAAEATATPSLPLQPTPSPTPIAFPRCPTAPSGDVIALCPAGARVDVDAAIGERDAALIVAQIADDLVAVQAEFEWTLRGTARIDVYATNERYAEGLGRVFGYPPATAAVVAESSVAFFEPALARIAVSWSAVQGRRPIAAIRHELTHLVTLEACAPRCDLVPAWLNEGQARLAEASIPGADWRLMRIRYEAASMVATGMLLPLSSLWTQSQWNAIGDWAGYYKYQEAARATELLRADIGERAVARLYARLRAGDDLARAYAALSGKSFSTYLATLSDRLAERIPPGPGIVVSTPGAEGRGPSYLLYAFPSEAKVSVRIRSRLFDQTREVTVSPQGASFDTIDDGYPPGTYTVTAASGGAVAAVTITKRGGRVVRETRD
jgi:hypothetical protein